MFNVDFFHILQMTDRNVFAYNLHITNMHVKIEHLQCINALDGRVTEIWSFPDVLIFWGSRVHHAAGTKRGPTCLIPCTITPL